MRVLYILAHFPQNSESYVEAEMAYVGGRRAQIEIWSPTAGYGDPSRIPVHRGSLKEALNAFRPDVVHIHHITTATYFIGQLPKDSVTIRAHSFDWDEALIRNLMSNPAVRKVFAFPHFAKQVPGIISLPVAYDPDHYYPCDKDRRKVVRLSAGLTTKNLGDFIKVGNRLGGAADFTLAINLVRGKESLLDELQKYDRSLGGHVKVVANLSRAEAAKLVRSAGIYLSTYDAVSHPFGMPISIAEAMATGAIVLARRAGPEVADYLGEATLTYGSIDEAVDRIRTTIALPDDELNYRRELSVIDAARFRNDVVLPRLYQEWNSICLDHF